MIESPGDLVGLSEISDMAGVVPSAVSNWLKRHDDFPRPWGSWRCGELWLRDEVEEWLARRYAGAQERRERTIQHHVRQLQSLTGAEVVLKSGKR